VLGMLVWEEPPLATSSAKLAGVKMVCQGCCIRYGQGFEDVIRQQHQMRAGSTYTVYLSARNLALPLPADGKIANIAGM
jgi:hypothetical protein